MKVPLSALFDGCSTATLDCKLKKFDTDEVIGEFRAQSDATDATGNEVTAQTVTQLAAATKR